MSGLGHAALVFVTSYLLAAGLMFAVLVVFDGGGNSRRWDFLRMMIMAMLWPFALVFAAAYWAYASPSWRAGQHAGEKKTRTFEKIIAIIGAVWIALLIAWGVADILGLVPPPTTKVAMLHPSGT